MRPTKLIDWNKRYSDSNDDYILRMLLPYAKGTYVEVGVWEPRTASNSYIFYEMGWTGLLIEPVPEWAAKAQNDRRKDTVLNLAISNVSGFTKIKVDGAQSSMDFGRTKHRGEKTIEVPMERLDTVLDKHPQFRDNCDFCCIDVEGHEKQVIESINFETFRPSVFYIEAVRWAPFYRTHKDWDYMILDNGYKLICHNLQNRAYGRKDDMDLWANAAKYNLAQED